MSRYYLFIFLIFVVLNSCQSTQNRENLATPYLNVSPEERGRIAYFNQMHRLADTTKSWRLVDEQNRLKRTKSDVKFGEWFELGSINLAGRVHTMDFDTLSASVYAASASGHIWSKRIEPEAGWTCMNNQFRISELIFVKAKSTVTKLTLYAGSGAYGMSAIYQTSDSGKTWLKANGLKKMNNTGYVKRFAFTDRHKLLFYALAEYVENNLNYVGLFYSSDGAKNFKQIWSELGFGYYYDIFAGQNDKLYLASESSISIVDTLGTINILGGIQPVRSGGVMLNGFADDLTENLVVAIYADGQTDFYKKGITGFWEFSSYLNEVPFMINSFSGSFSNQNNYYFGGVDFYKSSNGAASWTKMNDWTEYYANAEEKFHADIPAIKPFIYKKNEIVFTATDGGIYMSNNLFDNAHNLSLNGLNISQYYSSLSSEKNSNSAVFGSQDQGLQITDNLLLYQQNEFNQILAGDFGHLVSSTDGNEFWVVYPGFVAYSENLDIRYSFDFNQILWMPAIAQMSGNAKKIWLGGGSKTSGAYIYEMEFQTSKITSVQKAFNFASNSTESISALSFSPVNDSVAYVLTNYGRFFRTKDAGLNWVLTSNFIGPQAQYFYGSQILCSAQTDSLLFISGSAYEKGIYPVYWSKNQGETFEALGTELPNTLVSGLALSNNDSLLFAASEIGAYAYSFSLKHWYLISENSAPDVPYWSVEFIKNLNIARFSTYGRGLWDYQLSDEYKITKPILFQSIPDVLINTKDTLIEIHLDSFFYHTGGKTMEYQINIGKSSVCEVNNKNGSTIEFLVKEKSQTRIGIKAADENGYFAFDNFILNSNYQPTTPYIPDYNIKVYPNPVVGELNMIGFDPNADYLLGLYTLSGVKVDQLEVKHNNYGSILFSHFHPGVYILKIDKVNQKESVSFRIIKL
jgi:hypothetical protein